MEMNEWFSGSNKTSDGVSMAREGGGNARGYVT
jgi:hypothetical protein